MNHDPSAPAVLPLIEGRLAIIPLAVALEAECVGVNNTQIVFEVDGRERTYELPFGDGMLVRIERQRMEIGDALQAFEVAVPDQHGTHQVEVFASRSLDRWFVAGRISPRTV